MNNPFFNMQYNMFMNEAKKIKNSIQNNENAINNILNSDPELGDAILNDNIDVLTKLLISREQKEKQRLNELYQNYMDPKNQEEIEKIIKRKRLDETLNMAQNYAPELFIQTQMLFIEGKVNGFPVKIFLDTGAQVCVMPKDLAIKGNLMKDLDDRYTSLVKGVGTQNSLGRIHVAQLELKNKFFNFSATVLENMNHEIILGLDFFKRHRCIINLNSNEIEFSEADIKIPFLKDFQIENNNQNNNEDQKDLEEVKKNSMIEELVKIGIPREKAKEIWIKNNWDLQKAYSSYLDNL